ncbi:MAG: DUF3861 domain-containing protein [Dysgonamonadaceae bacterium]|jgi:hypothetical protein|nr:DUF3861 domain-containing protein [Dysgonamonadaceae bacterium]
MTENKNNKYKILFREIELKDGNQSGKLIEFDFENHDNVLDIIEIIRESGRFANENDNTQFVIGLKLFSDVMMRNKNNPLFEDFVPSFIQFMKKLKK